MLCSMLNIEVGNTLVPIYDFTIQEIYKKKILKKDEKHNYKQEDKCLLNHIRCKQK